MSHLRCSVVGCRKPARTKGTECAKHQKRRWRQANPQRAAFNDLRTNARRRGKPFLLSFDEFCGFCESTGYMDSRGNRAASDMHIDRIKDVLEDGSVGPYAIWNIRILSMSENSSKENHRRWAAKYGKSEELPAPDDDRQPDRPEVDEPW